MTFDNETLDARDVDLIIAGWDAMKPTEPNQPEPLFIWPPSFGIRYFLRVFVWKYRMRKSSWSFFHQQYQTWYIMIGRHYSALAGDQYQHPRFKPLWKYHMDAQDRLHENSISQAEWNKIKYTRQ